MAGGAVAGGLLPLGMPGATEEEDFIPKSRLGMHPFATMKAATTVTSRAIGVNRRKFPPGLQPGNLPYATTPRRSSQAAPRCDWTHPDGI